MIPRFKTVGDAIAWAEKAFIKAHLFFGHGSDNAWDEAVYLILGTLQLPLDSGKEIASLLLNESQQKMITKNLRLRIEKKIPVPYITHEAWFAGLPFYVDTRVLIPRSPFAELIQQYFEPWINPHKVHRILDLCTGSGCMAIACASAFPDALVDASDISAEALEVAKINVEKHQKQSHMTLYQSDLFNALPKERYDIIISNPPYVTAKEMAALPAEYHHEPPLALAAGKQGLDIVVKILQEASRHLTDQGILLIEMGNTAEQFAKHFPLQPGTWLDFEQGGHGIILITKKELK